MNSPPPNAVSLGVRMQHVDSGDTTFRTGGSSGAPPELLQPGHGRGAPKLKPVTEKALQRAE